MITHAGLLVLLAGSFYSVRTSDEGQVGMLEGDLKGELVRMDYPLIRVWEVDPHTQRIPARSTCRSCPARSRGGREAPARRASGALLSMITRAGGQSSENRGDLSKSGDPFQIVAKEYLAASAPAKEHVGTPTARPWPASAPSSRRRECPRNAMRSPPRMTSGSDGAKFFRAVRSPAPGHRRSSRSRPWTGPSWSRTSSSRR